MEFIKNHKLKQENGKYILEIYLNHINTEYANELDKIIEDKNLNFVEQIQEYIKTKFPNIKIAVCKVMLGSMLIRSFSVPNTQVFAATSQSNISESSFIDYKVQSGDSLWSIANKFKVTISEIKSFNNLTSDNIYIDQNLKIPSDDVYLVKSGDTLYKLAMTYNTTVDKIKKDNNLTTDNLYIGQKLIIDQANKSVEVTSYTVQKGDTLWKISQIFNISVASLKSINNLSSDNIYDGQVIYLKENVQPKESTITYTTHTVQSGDNTWNLSIYYGIPMQELLNANGLTQNSILNIGQKLTIPVHHIAVKETMGSQYGEYLDWWTEAQYVMTINDVAKVTDINTGRTFMVKRTIGANHADCEPLTSNDATIAKEIWGGYSWNTRAILVEVDGRKIASSMSFMPHGIQYIHDNNFDGHFDIHFLNSTRHKDGLIDNYHQENIKIAAGLK
ncbi:MAG: LysM peptidoglycan-binding domain-containing protein [Tepidibacter sp.]|jgi:LysM repeat protein|uniref:LysM peptidoglycan-binding domain-containing protein n=1 Tax=Tepidibacter sp. TaxID=2529387 RepID=UPI0025F3878E|nr:LysM peptidoglycan-binding domain-containing protein [Tepidibacter sp.]MCT4509464.1 LysM peptidoglycan-binding domain-containing protein [Tepidibacter sp.]